MISLVIPHVPYAPSADEMLNRCVMSLKGQYDELILVINDGIGYGASFNRGFKYTHGDYILAVSNDTELKSGTTQSLLIPNTITTPYIENVGTQFGAFFCMPRKIYELIGGFDERFKGAYFEDNDLLWRWRDAGIELKTISDVQITHEGGTTVKAIMNEGELMNINRQIFVEKWGRLP